MSYRHGNREQIGLFPPSIEEYVKEDDPVRAYDAIVESFDFSALGIELDSDKVGCPQYDPKAMLKLLVYGYSYGVRSSRKLERAVYHNVSFQAIRFLSMGARSEPMPRSRIHGIRKSVRSISKRWTNA